MVRSPVALSSRQRLAGRIHDIDLLLLLPVQHPGFGGNGHHGFTGQAGVAICLFFYPGRFETLRGTGMDFHAPDGASTNCRVVLAQ